MKDLTNTNRGLWYTLLNEPFTFFGGLLLFLMVFSPNYNVALKIVLIAVLLTAVITSRVIFDKLNVTRAVFTWYAIFIGHGLFFTVSGFLNGNNRIYLLRTTTYNIVWPVLYFLFTIGLYKKSSVVFFIRVLVIANFFISLYLIGSALTLFNILPSLGFITFGWSELSYDIVEGLVKVEIPAVISMMFTVPFIISFTLLSGTESLGFKKAFLYISVLLSIVGVICTARRGLILNIILGCFFTVIFSWWSRPSCRRILFRNVLRMGISGLLILIVALTAAERFGLLDLSLVFEKFSGAFVSRGEVSDVSVSIRYNQFDLLIKSWLQKPFFGHGHAAVSDFVVRSEKTPWIYELTYAALLFQTGAIGLAIYLGLLAWPVYKGLSLVRKGNYETTIMIIPVIVGSACFLIANGTNPYLQSYDFMWALFLPVAVINCIMKEQS